MIDKKVLHYKILDKLGEGGMGIVYKAEDTKLNREVAVKMLPPHLLVSPDDKTRFQREAKAAAALNHPNIATVYEINEHEGTPFIAMEYVEGQTLNHHIEKGPFKLQDAISVAIQVAEGLKMAHAKDIVHRDIKSSNIILGPDMQAKILDFGLAKTSMSTKLTQMGTTIGTVAYMSPEQVKGEEVDRHTDLWSLGVVLYEMIRGRLPYVAEYDQAIFYSIQNEDPEPLTSVRTGVPMALEWIVSKLMAKDPMERYQTANDLIIDLKAVDLSATGMSRVSSTTIQKTSEGAANPNPVRSTVEKKKKHSGRFSPIFISGSFILGALVTLLLFLNMYPKPVKEVRKYQWVHDYNSFILSPDGSKIAYSQGDNLYIRQLDQLEPVEIKNNKFVLNIIWSPHSDYIAYLIEDGSNRLIKKVAVDGGGNVLITKTAENYYPRYWGIDDSIVVTTWNGRGGNTLLKVSSSGGELKTMYSGDSTLAMINENVTHVQELPDGNTILLSKINYKKGVLEIFIQNNEKRSLLYEGPPESQIEEFTYDKRGFILYTRLTSRGENPEIWAIPFNLSAMQVSGKEFLVARDANQVSISKNGLLLYNRQSRENEGEQLVLLSRSGQILKDISQPQQAIYHPTVSQDGESIATASVGADGQIEIWSHDIKRNIKTQFTFDFGESIRPSWSPDRKKIVFQNGFSERANIYFLETNSFSEPKSLINSADRDDNPHWSHNGRYIFYSRLERQNNSQRNIWYLQLGEENSPKRLFQSRFQDDHPFMSPDGKYVAYASDKSGRFEIYVTNFPEADRQWQVSYDGGERPQWINDEIFFVNQGTNTLMVSKIKAGTDFQCEIPQALFSPQEAIIDLYLHTHRFGVTPDGQNILAVKSLGEITNRGLVLVENWLEEFK